MSWWLYAHHYSASFQQDNDAVLLTVGRPAAAAHWHVMDAVDYWRRQRRLSHINTLNWLPERISGVCPSDRQLGFQLAIVELSRYSADCMHDLDRRYTALVTAGQNRTRQSIVRHGSILFDPSNSIYRTLGEKILSYAIQKSFQYFTRRIQLTMWTLTRCM